MRVILTSGIFPPDIGGPATYVPTIASELQARGHSVAVLTTAAAGPPAPRGEFPFPVHRVSRRHAFGLRSLRFARALEPLAREADLIYANGMFHDTVRVARAVGRPVVAKFVGDEVWERATHRGWTDATFPEFQSVRQLHRVEIMRFLRRRMLGDVGHAIVPSEFFRGVVTRWGFDPQRISVVYNAALPTSAATHGARRSATGPLRVAAVGRLIPLKRVDLLIRAAAQLPAMELVVVGDGVCRSEWQGLADSLGVATRVCFAGAMRGSALHELLRNCDALALASDHENMPHALLEAMQLGLPVVATRVGGVGEIVLHGESGWLVDRGDLEGLVAAFWSLATDVRRRWEMGKAGQRRVSDRFSHKRMVEETEGILLACAGLHTSRCTISAAPGGRE